MSQQNVEVIRRVFEAWEQGDLKRMEPRLQDALAPDFETRPSTSIGSTRALTACWPCGRTPEGFGTTTA